MKSRIESDLEAVKGVAKSFLYLDVEETELGSLAVMHPIFESGIVFLKEYGVIDITENKENLNIARIQVEERINKQGNIFGVYILIRKSYRLTFLKYIKEYLSTGDFSSLLADAWVSSENPNQDVNVSVGMAAHWFRQADKKILMDADDYKIYNELPEEFLLYRGVSIGRNPKGLSWTRNIETAKWFAHRFDTDKKQGYIQMATAYKKDVLAYFNSRGEDEIVIYHKDLMNIHAIP